MQGKTGKTGLTQKEAIFQIIRSVLGAAFIEGMDVRPIVLKRNHQGRKEHNSALLNAMIEKIKQGLDDGTVPSEKYGKNGTHHPQYSVAGYARRIALYWLRRDKRLNGGARPRSEKRNKIEEYKWLREKDAILRALELLKDTKEDDELAKLEIQAVAVGRKFQILLTALGLNEADLPSDVLADFGVLPNLKKAA